MLKKQPISSAGVLIIFLKLNPAVKADDVSIQLLNRKQAFGYPFFLFDSIGYKSRSCNLGKERCRFYELTFYRIVGEQVKLYEDIIRSLISRLSYFLYEQGLSPYHLRIKFAPNSQFCEFGANLIRTCIGHGSGVRHWRGVKAWIFQFCLAIARLNKSLLKPLIYVHNFVCGK